MVDSVFRCRCCFCCCCYFCSKFVEQSMYGSPNLIGRKSDRFFLRHSFMIIENIAKFILLHIGFIWQRLLLLYFNFWLNSLNILGRGTFFFLNITFDSVNRRTHHTGALDQIASIHMFNVPKSVQFIFRVDGLRPHHTKWCFLGHDKLNHYYSLKPSKMIWTKVLKQRQQTPLKRA